MFNGCPYENLKTSSHAHCKVVKIQKESFVVFLTCRSRTHTHNIKVVEGQVRKWRDLAEGDGEQERVMGEYVQST